MKRHHFFALFTMLLVACGDSENSGTEASDQLSAATFEELPNCSTNRDGTQAFVEDERSYYLCDGGRWIFENALLDSAATLEDIANCSSKNEGDSVYIIEEFAVYKCSSGKWDISSRKTMEYKSVDDLPNCSGKREGEYAYVKEDSSMNVCVDGRWVSLGTAVPTEESLVNCSDKREGKIYFIVDIGERFICKDRRWENFDPEEEVSENSSASTRKSSNSATEIESSSSISENIPASSSNSTTEIESSSSHSSAKSSSSVARSSSSFEILGPACTGSDCSGSLWSISEGKAYAYQVQTPEVLACTGGAPDKMADYGAACYQSTGGWWFAYDNTWDNTAATAFITPADKNADGTWELITTYPEDGAVIPGGNLDKSKGLWATMYTTGVHDWPGIVGIGFNWTKAETAIDISSHDGFCISYYWDSVDELQMELGWDASRYGDDTWFFELPQGSKTLTLPWSRLNQGGWDPNNNTSVETATKNAVSLKFRVSNHSTTMKGGTFALQSLGWYDDGVCH